MPRIKIFENTELESEFNKRSIHAINEDEELLIGSKLIQEKYNSLNDELNDLKVSLGLKKSKLNFTQNDTK